MEGWRGGERTSCGWRYMSAKVESRSFSMAQRSSSRDLMREDAGRAASTSRPRRTPSLKSDPPPPCSSASASCISMISRRPSAE